MQNLRTWRTGVPGGGVSWNVYIIPHFAANVKIQYPNKVIRIRGKSCVWNRNATFRSAAYQKSRCTAAFFKGRAYAYGRRQKRHLSIGKAAGARKKAHPGERVGFCGITDLRTDRSGASRRGPSRTAQSYTSAYRSVRRLASRAYACSSNRGFAAGARKKAHPGERVGFCGITLLRTDRSDALRHGLMRRGRSGASGARNAPWRRLRSWRRARWRAPGTRGSDGCNGPRSSGTPDSRPWAPWNPG